MKKILFICNPKEPFGSGFDFACFIAKTSKACLVGIFMEDLDWEEVPVAKTLGSHNYIDYQVSTTLPDNEAKRAETEAKIKKFKEACVSKKVSFKVHIDRNIPLTELLTESRFADLIILDADTTFVEGDKTVPSKFVKSVLSKSECPVIITPQHFKKLDRIIFTYDGSANSISAIRQFTLLFPEFRDYEVSVVEILQEEEDCINEKYKLKEWLGMHYSNVELLAKKGDDEDELLMYLLNVQNALVVMDGFARSRISKLFSPSVSEPLVHISPQAFFITHFKA